jgi:hypothetical protein
MASLDQLGRLEPKNPSFQGFQSGYFGTVFDRFLDLKLWPNLSNPWNGGVAPVTRPYHVVSIRFIMDSISNDFSHLSFGDLHASSEPTTTPALKRISPERDTFTDDDHSFDEEILNAFSAFRRINEQPDLPLLLSNITTDKRLTTLTIDEAKKLINREPSMAGLLRNGWQVGSFKEVRQLGVFPICSTSTFN